MVMFYNRTLTQKLKRQFYRYLSADPADSSRKLYEQYGDDPALFRTHYYAWINRFLKRRCLLPSYRQAAAPFAQFLKMSPLIKQTLHLGGTSSQSLDQDPAGQGGGFRSVGIHIIQDWKIFTSLHKDRFIGQHIQIRGDTREIAGIHVIDYPCPHTHLDEHMDSSMCAMKIIFVYAYMLYHAEFCDWLTKYVAAHPATFIAVYFSDSHHMVEFGSSLAFVADYLISSHPDNYQVLSSINPYVYVDKIYLNQWAPEKALEKCRRSRFADRNLSLYGTFNFYPQFPRRNSFVTGLSREYGNTVKMNSAMETASWFAQSGDQALERWLRYGITLVVPTVYDFTTRVCDALSAGHAVLVPKGCTWMDSWIDQETQRELGIYRYLDLNAVSLRETYQRALARETSSDCQQRSERRSEFCVKHLSQDSLFESFLRITRLVLA